MQNLVRTSDDELVCNLFGKIAEQINICLIFEMVAGWQSIKNL